MWKQFRKTFLFNQLFILVACAASYFYFFPGKGFLVLVLFLAMEMGSICGAWWGARLTKKLEEAKKKLPLERK